ncbi:hypothetical protein BDF14DRAFT_1199785 [Spinellus fusiger]|nr:hypothetical protein BDF14DRAFT_1199785 [Spinellus fusiger]
MSNQESEFPLVNKQAACTVLGHHTEYGKIGSLIQTTFDIAPHLASNPAAVPTTSRVLLGESMGTQYELYSLYATSIAQAVAAMNPHEKRSLLLGIALKPTDSMQEQKQVFHCVIDLVMAHTVW